MRNVVFTQFISLDGVAEEPGDWFIEDGPELFENIARICLLYTSPSPRD